MGREIFLFLLSCFLIIVFVGGVEGYSKSVCWDVSATDVEKYIQEPKCETIVSNPGIEDFVGSTCYSYTNSACPTKTINCIPDFPTDNCPNVQITIPDFSFEECLDEYPGYLLDSPDTENDGKHHIIKQHEDSFLSHLGIFTYGIGTRTKSEWEDLYQDFDLMGWPIIPVLRGATSFKVSKPGSLIIPPHYNFKGDDGFALWLKGPNGVKKLVSGANTNLPLIDEDPEKYIETESIDLDPDQTYEIIANVYDGGGCCGFITEGAFQILKGVAEEEYDADEIEFTTPCLNCGDGDVRGDFSGKVDIYSLDIKEDAPGSDRVQLFPKDPDARASGILSLNGIKNNRGHLLCGYPESIDVTFTISGWYDDRWFLFNWKGLPDSNAFLSLRESLIPKINDIFGQIPEGLEHDGKIYSNDQIKNMIKQKDIWITEKFTIRAWIDEYDNIKWIRSSIKDEITTTNKDGNAVNALYVLDPEKPTKRQSLATKIGSLYQATNGEGGVASAWKSLVDSIVVSFFDFKNEPIINSNNWAKFDRNDQEQSGIWQEEMMPFESGFIRLQIKPSFTYNFNELEQYSEKIKTCCSGATTKGMNSIYIVRNFPGGNLNGEGYEVNFSQPINFESIKTFRESDDYILPDDPIITTHKGGAARESCSTTVLSTETFNVDSDGGDFITDDAKFKLSISKDSVIEDTSFKIRKLFFENCDYDLKVIDIDPNFIINEEPPLSEGESTPSSVGFSDLLNLLEFYVNEEIDIETIREILEFWKDN